MWFKADVGFDTEQIEWYDGYVKILSDKLSNRATYWKVEIVPIILETPVQDIGIDDSKRHSIPTSVKREVWQRDQGRCTNCNSQENLEYDHIIPVSKGGANTTRNIQLLCEKCNRTKLSKRLPSETKISKWAFFGHSHLANPIKTTQA